MVHLKLRKKDEYRYQTAEIGEVVRIDVEYSKMSTTRGRGIWFRATLVTIEQHENYKSESFVLFTGGTSVFVAPLLRSTPKVLDAIAAQVDPLVPELAALFLVDKEAVKERVKALFAPKPAEVTA